MQQINLNQPELWPKPIPFNVRQMAVALVALIVAAGVVIGLLVYDVDRRRAVLAGLEEERDAVQKELAARKAAQKQRQRRLKRLEEEVATLQKRLSGYQQARQAMERRLAAAGKKAALVRGLGEARRGRPDVWLTRFQLNGVGEVDVTLEGRASVPEAIPQYLQAVADQSAFRKGFFQDLSATEPEKSPEEGLQFESRTRFSLRDAQAEGKE